MKTSTAALFFSALILLTSCNLLGSKDKENHSDIAGKIVFSAKDSAGTYQIFTMQADGTNLKQLTDYGPEAGGYQPDWSPDGSQILFSSFKSGSSIGPALWVMNANGSNKHLLYKIESSSRALEGNNARWSPNGTKVVFDLCLNCQIETNNDIYVFDTKSKKVTQLTTNHNADTNPSWSPDGKRIVFVSNRDYVKADTLRFRHDLYMINVDGSDLQRITERGYAREPIWSPNGKSVVFRSTGNSPGLYRINIQTKSIAKLKDDINNRIHLHPNSWSLNGYYLLITERLLDIPNTNSLNIFDISNNNSTNIYSKSSNQSNQLIDGADLYVL